MFDGRGQPLVAHPAERGKPLLFYAIFYLIGPVVAPVVVGYKLVTDKLFRSTATDLYSIVKAASAPRRWYFQDGTLLGRLWSLASARAYLDKDRGEPRLEYQVSEGYCGAATMHCVLRGLGLKSADIPEQRRGETKPEVWCERIRAMARDASEGGLELETRIVWGDVSYQEFLSTLRKGLANSDCRVAVNYLRSALTGFELSGWRGYFPMFVAMKVFAGHFSPVVGIIEEDVCDSDREEEEKKTEGADDAIPDNPLVGIWDTNHTYGGTYLVPARKLYDAVHAVDVSSGKHRAMILVEKKKAEQVECK